MASPRTASATAPGHPSSQGSASPGSCAAVVAVAAIHDAGTHASAARPDCSQGTAAVRHAARPSTVATGAAGPASRFARTPYTGTVGWMRISSGPQASWAASGTASASASGRGTARASPAASGRAHSSSAAVAATESAKPSDAASQGSNTSSTVTAVASSAIPTPARPRSTASIAMAAMAAARTTLGSGVTSTTNPTSTVSPQATRSPREAPSAAARAKAMPTTSAQLAPDTAVRCESDAAFIAASSVGDTMDVSPTASPGTRPAPSPGRPPTARTSPRRSSAAAAAAPSAAWTTSTPRDAQSTTTARSPVRPGLAVPRICTTAPTSR